jgi:hypothetical protein
MMNAGISRGAWLALLPAIFGPVFVGGCGHSGRQAIEGNVTLQGVPLDKGFIAFRPLPGTNSPGAGGNVAAGKFSIAGEKGLMPGKFRVEITAIRKTDKKVQDPILGLVPLEEQYIPAKYNDSSQLEIDVPAGGGTITKDFALTN